METSGEMLLEIDQRIIDETTYCKHNCGCLRNKDYLCRLAKVESFVGKEVLFIHCGNRSCNYKIHFGYGQVCHCPVRIEIHKKFQL
jgi:hypothetical protein